MYIPRLELYDLERPSIALMILDHLERHYLQSVHEQLASAVQHERLEAWRTDARTAADALRAIQDDYNVEQIRASFLRSQSEKNV